MHLRNRRKVAREVSIYEPIGTDKEGNQINFMDIIESEEPDIVERMDKNSKICYLQKRLPKILNDRELEIVVLRYGLQDDKPVTQKQIAGKLGISRSYVSRIEKRALEKIQLDEIKPSSRKYPYIDFRPNREIGNEVLTVEDLSKTIDGEKVLDHVSFVMGHDDKIAFVGSNELAKSTLFKILAGEMEPDEGNYKWGVTTSQSYFPKDNTEIFDTSLSITEWLTQFSEIKDATYVRGFLGRMLFAGEDGVKKMKVLSGGEKVRVLLSRMMIEGSNVLIFDEPTDHLDMEAITALNNGMMKFSGTILFACRDHQVVQTTANRIIEILPDGTIIDKITTYDEYLESDEMARKRTVYTSTATEED